MKVLIYCENCNAHQPFSVDPMKKDPKNADSIWGDLVCLVCRFVIATLTVEEEGIYEFRKAAEKSEKKEAGPVE